MAEQNYNSEVIVKGFTLNVQKALDFLNEKTDLDLKLGGYVIIQDKYLEIITEDLSKEYLGVFELGYDRAYISTFLSNILQNGLGEWEWITTWDIVGIDYNKGVNCISIANMTYNIDKDEWEIKLSKGK